MAAATHEQIDEGPLDDELLRGHLAFWRVPLRKAIYEPLALKPGNTSLVGGGSTQRLVTEGLSFNLPFFEIPGFKVFKDHRIALWLDACDVS